MTERKANEARADEARADEARADEARADEARADEARATEARVTEAERQRLRAAQRVLLAAIGAASAEAIDEQQRTGFAALGLDARDAEALRRADGRRIRVYRALVRATLIDAIALELPRTAARLGARFEREAEAFLCEELPRSQVLRDVAYEFAAWAAPRWRRDEAIGWLADLARYELLEFDVLTARRRLDEDGWEQPDPLLELDSALGVDFDGSVRVARFEHAVQRLAEDDDGVPERAAGGLLAYRDDAGELRKLDLTPMATTILALLWCRQRPLGEAVTRACALHGHAVDRAVIDGTATVLADLAERGALLGARPLEHPAPPPSPFAYWLYGPGLEAL